MSKFFQFFKDEKPKIKLKFNNKKKKFITYFIYSFEDVLNSMILIKTRVF